LDNLPNTACSLLWSHARLKVDGTVLPCCFVEENNIPNIDEVPKLSDGLNNAFNSKFFNDIRDKMLKGEKLSMCNKCWHAEDSGIESFRQRFKDFDKFIGQEPKIRYIETALSTHCNLSCRMCNDNFSSKWRLINNPGISVDVSVDSFDLEYYDTDLSKLEFVKFVGGEPLLDKKHANFLKQIINKSDKPENVRLYYHTNGTIIPKQEIFDLWSQLKGVRITFSIDAIGEANEILRPPHKWSTIDNTVNHFIEHKTDNIELGMHTVANVFNIHLMKDIVEYSFKKFNKMPGFDLLDWPEHMSLKHLDKDTKQKLSHLLKSEFEGHERLDYLLDFINQPTEHSYTLDQIIDKEKENDNKVNTMIENLGIREVWNSF